MLTCIPKLIENLSQEIRLMIAQEFSNFLVIFSQSINLILFWHQRNDDKWINLRKLSYQIAIMSCNNVQEDACQTILLFSQNLSPMLQTISRIIMSSPNYIRYKVEGELVHILDKAKTLSMLDFAASKRGSACKALSKQNLASSNKP